MKWHSPPMLSLYTRFVTISNAYAKKTDRILPFLFKGMAAARIGTGAKKRAEKPARFVCVRPEDYTFRRGLSLTKNSATVPGPMWLPMMGSR